MQLKQLSILTVIFSTLFMVVAAARSPDPDEAVRYIIFGQSYCDCATSLRITQREFPDNLDDESGVGKRSNV